MLEKEASSEERGDFEAYAEQSVLSPTTNQGELAQIRVKERGKQRAETKESSNFELLALLKEMKKEMRER